MCNKRTCKVCNIEKNLETDFSFHKTTGYYHRTCKDCANIDRRKNFIPKNARKDENNYCIRQKVCINCKESKDINKENFKSVQNSFAKICRVCHDKILADRKPELIKGHLPDDTIKVCKSCNEEKSILDFGYNKKSMTYCYSCRKCESKRTSTRNQIKDYPISSLIRAYRTFDENRGLEFNLTKEYVEDALNKRCSYCSHPSTGLDRLDNNLGHTIENTIPCCRDCNTAKMNNFTTEEMYVIGKAIKEVKDKRLKP